MSRSARRSPPSTSCRPPCKRRPASWSAASALLLIVAGGVLPNTSRKTFAAPKDGHKPASVGLDLLMSAPVLRNLLFFLCIGMANGGIQTYSVVALGQLWDTAPATANIG